MRGFPGSFVGVMMRAVRGLSAAVAELPGSLSNSMISRGFRPRSDISPDAPGPMTLVRLNSMFRALDEDSLDVRISWGRMGST